MTRALEERFGLDGKAALVTGGGAGIGRAVCLTLAEAGAAVVVQDVDPEAAEAVAATIREAGGRATSVAGDISRPATVEATLQRVGQAFGRLDISVHNAGIFPFAPLLDLPLELWDRVLHLNLRATFVCTQLAGRMMVNQGGGGRIVNLASIQGLRPSAPGLIHYNTSKAGVVMVTRTAALELAPHDITVNAVAPGVTETPGTRPLIESQLLGDPRESIPLRRWGRPEDVANLILYLVSPAAAYVTGEVVVIDGGALLK